jgi:hypothetical protein
MDTTKTNTQCFPLWSCLVAGRKFGGLDGTPSKPLPSPDAYRATVVAKLASMAHGHFGPVHAVGDTDRAVVEMRAKGLKARCLRGDQAACHALAASLGLVYYESKAFLTNNVHYLDYAGVDVSVEQAKRLFVPCTGGLVSRAFHRAPIEALMALLPPHSANWSWTVPCSVTRLDCTPLTMALMADNRAGLELLMPEAASFCFFIDVSVWCVTREEAEKREQQGRVMSGVRVAWMCVVARGVMLKRVDVMLKRARGSDGGSGRWC